MLRFETKGKPDTESLESDPGLQFPPSNQDNLLNSLPDKGR